jgi:hypothetical protein
MFEAVMGTCYGPRPIPGTLFRPCGSVPTARQDGAKQRLLSLNPERRR